MIDFVEYIISELKSKRLSKKNALALIKQFYLHSSTVSKVSVIHPLLHTNTSDLSLQSYSTTFTGEEFFLDDHQVNMDGIEGIKILPGVVYLEMARVAVEQALPVLTESNILELRNIVWLQPVVVNESVQIEIALQANDDNEQIDFEIYSQDPDTKKTVHSQGQAVFSAKPAHIRLDIEQLKEEMCRGELKSDDIYAAYIRMKLNYGPAHQVITTIYQGERQLLAQLRMPEALAGQDKYLLHPGVMDGALQSTLGLIDDLNQIPDKPSLPFALEELCIFSACTKDMLVWVRYAEGSKPGDKIAKLDIDLCDMDGNVCIQIKGFSSRTLTSNIVIGQKQSVPVGSLLASPVWESRTLSVGGKQPAYAQPLLGTFGFAGKEHRRPLQ